MRSWQAMNAAIEARDPDGRPLDAGVALLLVTLASYVRPENGADVFPGVKTLADRMGCDVRTARRRKTAARRLGLISVKPRERREGRGRSSDLIHLDFLDDQPDGGAPLVPDDQPDGAGQPTGQPETTNRTYRVDQPDRDAPRTRREPLDEEAYEREGRAEEDDEQSETDPATHGPEEEPPSEEHLVALRDEGERLQVPELECCARTADDAAAVLAACAGVASSRHKSVGFIRTMARRMAEDDPRRPGHPSGSMTPSRDDEGGA
jgi:hypothetical protein